MPATTIVVNASAPAGQRPLLTTTASGTPQVNIQSAIGGVSRNRYTQFDVGSKGLILNNAAVSSNTQLAGWVAGNPQLASGSASIILNEVSSANPSLLRGYIEVAGQRAEVVIATRVAGQEQTLLYEAQDLHTSSTTTRSQTSAGAFISAMLDPLGLGMPIEDKTSSDQRATSTAIATRLISDKKVEIGVGTKTELRGTEVQAQQIAFVQTDPTKAGELILGGSTNTTQTAHTEKTETLGLYQEMKGQGQTTQTMNTTRSQA